MSKGTFAVSRARAGAASVAAAAACAPANTPTLHPLLQALTDTLRLEHNKRSAVGDTVARERQVREEIGDGRQPGVVSVRALMRAPPSRPRVPPLATEPTRD